MFRVATVVLALVLTPAVASAQSLQGVWKMVEREVRGGQNPGIIPESEIQPRILIYTERHYALEFVGGTEPRPVLGDSPTDAEIVEVVRRYTSQAGTYEVNGSTITYAPIVHLNPALMVPEYTYSREFRVTAETLETRGTNSQGVTTIHRYRRIE